MLALALECGADVNAANEDGSTALMLAAQGGHTAIVLAMGLECGADVSATKLDGSTALMLAAQGGHTATSMALAENTG